MNKAEHHTLTKRANKTALSTYIHSVLFSKNSINSNEYKNDFAKILVKLGQSNIAAYLSELTQLARSGSLLLTPETTTKLEKASNDIAEIKSMLMKALSILKSINLILKTSQPGGGKQLGQHLMRTDDNAYVEAHEITDFVSHDVVAAFKDVHACSQVTKCKQLLFRITKNPPEQEQVPVDVFENIIDGIEKKQPT